jgi:DNA-binding transcriptional MerR regulator
MNRDPHHFTIGEFSRITGLSIKTLRFYDEKGLLPPAAVADASGYRYYDASSLERARIITRQRELQFPLQDIAAVLAECSDDSQLISHFQLQLKVIQERLRTDQRTAKALEAAIACEAEAAALTAVGKFKVEERKVEPVIVAGCRMRGRYSDCGNGFRIIAKAMGRFLAGKPLCLYYDGEFKEEDADFEPCFPLRRTAAQPAGISVRTLPAVHCLTLIHQGPWPQLGRSYRLILSELHRRGLSAVLPTRECYLKGPGMIFKGSPRNYLTEIQIPFAEVA